MGGDQVIRALQRAGLQATQLSSGKLIELFFEIYNEVAFDSFQSQPAVLNPVAPSAPKPAIPLRNQAPPQSMQAPPMPEPPLSQHQSSRNHPFIVEELSE